MTLLPRSPGTAVPCLSEPDGGIGAWHAALHANVMVTVVLVPEGIPSGPQGCERDAVTLMPGPDRAYPIIYLSGLLTPGELCATTVHELHHIIDPAADEDTVEHRAACSLVPEWATEAAASGVDVAVLAEHLDVDPPLIRARVRGVRERMAS